MGLTPLSGLALVQAVGPTQGGVLSAHGFDSRTPLWYYILAEAGASGGARLGPVGSRMFAETLWNMIRFSPDSIIGADGRVQGGAFTLADLINLSKNGA